MRNIFGDQGNMQRNFWELQGNSVKVNVGEHLNLFLRNKGTTVNFHREQGNMHPPTWEALIVLWEVVLDFNLGGLGSSVRLFGIMGRDLDDGNLMGSVWDSGKCFEILGSILRYWEVLCDYWELFWDTGKSCRETDVGSTVGNLG